jgi:hypothetical protein
MGMHSTFSRRLLLSAQTVDIWVQACVVVGKPIIKKAFSVQRMRLAIPIMNLDCLEWSIIAIELIIQ